MRMAWLYLAVLASAVTMYAGNTENAITMTGSLCDMNCVTQSSGRAACDQGCAEKSGEIIFIDGHGRILRIANQEKVMRHAGKKVKMNCRPVKGLKDNMYVDSVSLYGGGG